MCMSFRIDRRDVNPFETDTPREDSINAIRLYIDVSINWPSNRNWQTKVLDS